MLHFIGFPFREWHITWIRHCSLSLVFSHFKWDRIRWTSLMFRRPSWCVCTRPWRCGYIGTGWIHISRFFTISTPISYLQFFKASKSKFGLKWTNVIRQSGLTAFWDVQFIRIHLHGIENNWFLWVELGQVSSFLIHVLVHKNHLK